MKIFNEPSPEKLTELLTRPVFEQENIMEIIKAVFQKVKTEGDSALSYYSQKFDAFAPENIELSKNEWQKAAAQCPKDLQKAINQAAANIKKFHTAQKQSFKTVETMKGINCWQKSTPIEKVGLYIPGGTAPLFSSVLMLAIPAQTAGYNEIILCTPPSKSGIHPAIAYAAKISGVHKIFLVGGAQAIAAMTYGTKSIPKVYKIFGPGNQYVTAAKQYAFLEGTAIDMPAGPSEVLVFADKTAKPEFVAADLLSQAEHGIDSQVILIAKNQDIVNKVIDEIEKQLKLLQRQEIAKTALTNSRAFIIKDDKKAIDLINQYAPEHLILSVKNYKEIEKQIINAGSIFLGNYTPESAGDYASGTNHTLPTNAYAKMFSGVSLDSFMKKITIQEISKQGLKEIGNIIETMAAAEQLTAHKNAVSIRLKI